jgi:hypothetical protein
MTTLYCLMALGAFSSLLQLTCVGLGQVNFCWPSLTQAFLVPSPLGLMTIVYHLTILGVMQLYSHCSRPRSSLYSLGTDRTENIASDSSSVTVYISVAKRACSLSHCLAVDVSSGSSIQVFRYHITLRFIYCNQNSLLTQYFLYYQCPSSVKVPCQCNGLNYYYICQHLHYGFV